MSWTRRGFIGALLATPIFVRLSPFGAKPAAPQAAPPDLSDFNTYIRAHEIELRHAEANLYDKILSPRERENAEREVLELRAKHAGPFPRWEGHEPHHSDRWWQPVPGKNGRFYV